MLGEVRPADVRFVRRGQVSSLFLGLARLCQIR
jgi:hypothetical protein